MTADTDAVLAKRRLAVLRDFNDTKKAMNSREEICISPNCLGTERGHKVSGLCVILKLVMNINEGKEIYHVCDVASTQTWPLKRHHSVGWPQASLILEYKQLKFYDL